MARYAALWDHRPVQRPSQRLHRGSATGACLCEAAGADASTVSASALPDVDGSIGDSWLDRLPGLVAGALFRRKLERHFRQSLQGEVFTYAEEHRLRLHLLRPTKHREAEQLEEHKDAVGTKGCIVFLHGGGFVGGAPSQFYPYARVAAERFGLASALCEFRTTITHPTASIPFDPVADVQRCVRFLQEQSDRLGFDGRKVVLAGASSGGHLAAMAALGGDSAREPLAEPPRGDGLGLAGLVLFNPVLDLRFQEGWDGRPCSVYLGARLLRALHGTRALDAMSPLWRAQQDKLEHVPYPTLILHGTADHLVPLEEVEAFQQEMRKHGNACDLVTFPGEGHFFFNWRISQANFRRCVGLLEDYLTAVGLLPSRPPDQAARGPTA